MSDLSDFLKLMSEAKATDPKHQKIKEIKESVKSDVDNFFQQLSGLSPTKIIADEIAEIEEKPSTVEEVKPVEVTEDVSQAEVLKLLAKQPEAASFQQPVVDTVSQDLKTITKKLKYLEQWVGKISATGPGGGEVNLRWLDDVDRPTIYDMRYLRYNDAKKKFEFAEVNPHDIVYTTHLVTTPTYTIDDDDYYVGVNYAGPTTISLPLTPSSGRMIIIKDESGDAETNPITVQGTVDNDAGGFIIQINNGAIQLIYRNGWRIV